MGSAIDFVHPQLAIANITAARTHSMGEFDAVITVCQDSIEDHIPEGVDYHHFDMCDGPTGQPRGSCDYDIFEQAATTILMYLEAGDTVLVHCHAGQSRSSSTSIAAIGVYEQQGYFTTFDEVKDERPQIHPVETLVDHSKRYIEEHTGIHHGPDFGGEDGVY